MKNNTLENSVADFIANKRSLIDINELLYHCVLENSVESLSLVIELAKQDYNDFTYNFELKFTSFASALYWEKQGVDRIVSVAMGEQKRKEIRMICEILSHCIKGSLYNLPFIKNDTKLFNLLDFKGSKYDSDEFKGYCKEGLIKIMVNIEQDIVLPISIFNSLL